MAYEAGGACSQCGHDGACPSPAHEEKDKRHATRDMRDARHETRPGAASRSVNLGAPAPLRPAGPLKRRSRHLSASALTQLPRNRRRGRRRYARLFFSAGDVATLRYFSFRFCWTRCIFFGIVTLVFLTPSRPEWRNGRRSRLTICRPRGCVGSTPTSGTSFFSFMIVFAFSLL